VDGNGARDPALMVRMIDRRAKHAELAARRAG